MMYCNVTEAFDGNLSKRVEAYEGEYNKYKEDLNNSVKEYQNLNELEPPHENNQNMQQFLTQTYNSDNNNLEFARQN